MNQDSAHSEQNSPVAGTAETHQNQQNTSNRQYSSKKRVKVILNLLKIRKLN